MLLLCVVDVETLMIKWNRNHVEKSLKIGIPVSSIEQLLERSLFELIKSVETMLKKPDVLVT